MIHIQARQRQNQYQYHQFYLSPERARYFNIGQRPMIQNKATPYAERAKPNANILTIL